MASLDANMVDETQNLHTSQLEHETEVHGGEIGGGSSGRLWSMYLTETQNQDKEMVERWMGEADSALIFAGLFSAVVAVSLVESYKWLSPDPSNETLAVLTQISRQLVNISKGLESVAVESSQPFKPTASVVLVNVTWFGSIVLCLASTVFATLVQQWARRYLELTQGRGAPHERARLRTFMFNGLRRFRVDRLLLLLPMSLHASILLYCVGLINYIFTINTNIGFCAFVYLIYFYLQYATLTVLPFFYFDCPYTTPVSAITWRITQAFLLGIFLTIRGIVDRLFHTLSTLWPRAYLHVSRSPGPARWRVMLEERISKHRRWLSNGLQRSVELCATEGPQAVDSNALEWTLTALDNNSDKEIEDFAAWVPELFDTYASGASGAILPFMSDKPPTIPIFGFRLHHLLNICILRTSALPEEERKRRLRLCLKCLWYWVKAYSENPESLPSYFPLPDIDMIPHLQSEQDPIANLTGRCFGALVAKKLAADVDVNLSHSSSVVRDAKLEYLSTILGSTSTKVKEFLIRPGVIDLANIVSLISGGMDTLVTEKVPSEVLDLFQKTVDILLADLTSQNAEFPPGLVAIFHETHSNAQRLQAPDWLMDQLQRISEKLSELRGAQQAIDGPFGNV